jgi:hypothetical protein
VGGFLNRYPPTKDGHNRALPRAGGADTPHSQDRAEEHAEGEDVVEVCGQLTFGSDDPLPNEHNICSTTEPTLAFLGFVRPNVGAIPPMSEMQMFWWIERLRGNIPGPRSEPRYKLVGQHCARTVAYACDYGLYMHDLAKDIGAVPNVWQWCAFFSFLPLVCSRVASTHSSATLTIAHRQSNTTPPRVLRPEGQPYRPL